jgi:hypothetical protein
MNEQDVQAQLETLRSMIAEGFAETRIRFDGVDARFDGVDRRLDGMDTRLDGVNARLGVVETEVRHAHVLIEDLRDQVKFVAEGFEMTNEKLDRQYAQLDSRVTALEGR